MTFIVVAVCGQCNVFNILDTTFCLGLFFYTTSTFVYFSLIWSRFRWKLLELSNEVLLSTTKLNHVNTKATRVLILESAKLRASAKHRATGALCLTCCSASRALVSHLPRALRSSSSTCLVSYVFPCLTCLVPYMLSFLTCLVPYVLSCLTCFVPYVLLCLTCLVLYVLQVPCALCASCHTCVRALRVLVCHVSYVLLYLTCLVPRALSGCSCLELYLLLCSSCHLLQMFWA